MTKIRIEVHYFAEMDEKDFARLLRKSKESGHSYGEDPGPKEIVRRFLMSDGLDEAEVDAYGFIYTERKV